MVNLTIDQQVIIVDEGITILEAAAQYHIPIPHLCYLKDINEIGACRVCVVELKGNERLITACNTVVKEGMELYTNSPKVREARRMNVELLLSQHNCECASCVRSRNCSLQTLANDLGILKIPFDKNLVKSNWNQDFPLIRDSDKCIKCMRCIQICDKIQGMNIWDVSMTGARTSVNVTLNRKIEDSDCTICGQCITHCPVAALRERDDTEKVFAALNDPEKIVVVQMAPAVRSAWAEEFGLSQEEISVNHMVAALRKMGFDYVFDTDFGADLTIMEEGSEFLERLTKHKENLPMFTSCCPGWMRFIKGQYPQLVKHLSSAKSPHQMFGTITKTYFADLLQVDAKRIFNVSIMPCVAKKAESALPTLDDAHTGSDVDVVLTTRELNRMIRSEHISVQHLEEEAFDLPLGESTGAGVIFGATGGVMEAALRTAYFLVTNKNAEPDAFKEVRGDKGWKEATFTIDGNNIRVAVVSGLANARNLLDAILKKEAMYEFIEVMACPGGCTGGGGQPIHDGEELASLRSRYLYELDENAVLRYSHENPSVLKLYNDFLDKPLSKRSEELLHTDHEGWQMPAK